MGHPARGDFLRGGSRSVRNVKELGGSCCGRGTSGEGGWEMLRSGDMLCGWGSLRVGAAAGRNVKE